MTYDSLRGRIRRALDEVRELEPSEISSEAFVERSNLLLQFLSWIDDEEQTDINDAKFNAMRRGENE